MDQNTDKIKPKRVLFVMGTRPEIIKVAPVIDCFKKEGSELEALVCNTAQHRDMSDQLCSFFDINVDFDLDVMVKNQRLLPLLSKLLLGLDKLLEENEVDGVLAQGDTMSVFAASLAAFFAKKPFFHLEAGLRSYDLEHPFPEEFIRQCGARGAALHLIPTEAAQNALISEGISSEKIKLTGNTVVDAVLATAKRTQAINSAGKDLVLITAHRRENHGERLKNIVEAVKKLAEDFTECSFVLPVHPNPNVKNVIHEGLGNISNINLVEPMEYADLVAHLKSAKLILTDSGGIQEEAPAFNCPVLVLRDKTERNEGVEAGFAKLVGADTDLILKEAREVLNKNFEESRIVDKANPYGDGEASVRVYEEILTFFKTHNKMS